MMRWPLLSLISLSACNGDMVAQPRQDSYERSALFADSLAMQAPPDGAIAQDGAAADRPPAIDMAMLRRGHERYDIYCAPCHGSDGRGKGIVVTRGFPTPRTFLDPRVDLSSDHVAGVIGHGQGLMYGFSDRIAPNDRCAIVAYVRALVLAQKGAAGRGA